MHQCLPKGNSFYKLKEKKIGKGKYGKLIVFVYHSVTRINKNNGQ